MARNRQSDIIAFSASIINDKKIARKLRRLASERVAKKAGRSAVSAGLTVMVKAIKKEIPPSAKRVRKSIGKSLVKNDSGVTEAKVGINIGKKSGKNYFFASAMYVQGTIDRVTLGKKSVRAGVSRGKVAPHPVVRDGFNKAKTPAMARMKEKFWEVIKREAKKR